MNSHIAEANAGEDKIRMVLQKYVIQIFPIYQKNKKHSSSACNLIIHMKFFVLAFTAMVSTFAAATIWGYTHYGVTGSIDATINMICLTFMCKWYDEPYQKMFWLCLMCTKTQNGGKVQKRVKSPSISNETPRINSIKPQN